jgi:hypothetical protein
MTPDELLGLYLSAALVLMVYSFFLYKNNPLFHIAQSLAIATVLANTTVIALKSIYDIAWTPAIQGKDSALWLACLAFSAILFIRYIPKYAWVSRLPLALVVGCGIGLGVRGAVSGDFLDQLYGTIKPIIGGATTPLDNLIQMVFTLSIIAYFIFTREHKGFMMPVSKIARYGMMITFGAIFGTTSIDRVTTLATRLVILLRLLGLNI